MRKPTALLAITVSAQGCGLRAQVPTECFMFAMLSTVGGTWTRPGASNRWLNSLSVIMLSKDPSDRLYHKALSLDEVADMLESNVDPRKLVDMVGL